MSKGRWISLFLIGIVVMSVLGTLSGKWIADWKAERAHEARVEKLHRGEASRLRMGDPFPEVSVIGMEGLQTPTTALLNGKEALVVFLAPHCASCAEAFLPWEPYLQRESAHTRVIGIASAGKDEVLAIATGLPFPVFADEQDVFGHRYELHAVPTVMGVRADGSIAFIRHGISEDFTPEAAEKLMAKPG